MDPTRTCSICGEVKAATEFYGTNKLQCKPCKKLIRLTRINSDPKEYFKELLKSAKQSAKERGEKGRVEASEFSITLEDVMKLHTTQNGKCAYSGIPYVCLLEQDWRASIERLNPQKGYVLDNIALVVLELNGCAQWSYAKIEELKGHLCTTFEPQTADFKCVRKNRENRGELEQFIINDIECVKCKFCSEVKPKVLFNSVLDNGCKECISKYHKDYKKTPYGHVKQMMLGMKSRTKERNDKGRNHDECDISYEDCVQIFNDQSGLCFYSGIPMKFGSYIETNWICSAERLDESKGYIKGNVCLICFEFNTGHSNVWSKEKISYLKKHLITT